MMAKDPGTCCSFRISTLVRMNSLSGSRPGIRARGDQNVLRLNRPHALRRLDVDPPAALQSGEPGNDLDLVLPHQARNALGVTVHDVLLALHHRRQVQLRVLAGQALLGRVGEVVPDFGRVQQRFGGHAAHVQARPSQLRVLLDECGFQSILTGANGGGVPAGAASNHN
jgi:hypothetical protein